MHFDFSSRFILGFDSPKLDNKTRDKLKILNPAGIIFYDANIDNHQQFVDLIKDLQDSLGKSLLLSTDQEGGKVQRLRKITTSLPSLESLKSLDDVKEQSLLLAQQLKALGINLVLGPCLDLNTNSENPIIGSRSFGIDNILEKVNLVLNIFKDNNLLACIKHYPGHGDTIIDSHLSLPCVKRTQAELSRHLEPFDLGIKMNCDSLMLAHLIVNDAKIPASLDSVLIQNLRKIFHNLIISDEITMKALKQFGDYSELSLKLLEAGNDLIIWNTNLDDAFRAAEYLQENYHNQEQHIKALERVKFAQSKISTKLSKKGFSYLDERMLSIALRSIYVKAEDKISSWKNLRQDAQILVSHHPKLELEYIKMIFPSAALIKDQALEPNKKLLILSFQAKEQEIEIINSLKQNLDEQVLVASCDLDENFAEIRIPGANLVHYASLAQFLGLENFAS